MKLLLWLSSVALSHCLKKICISHQPSLCEKLEFVSLFSKNDYDITNSGMRLEKLELNPSVYNNSNACSSDETTHNDPKDCQKPVKIPCEAAPVRSSNLEPHEARYGKGNRNGVQTTNKTCQAC
ncbi:hypothetical protein M758_3G078000 [Ceratodon purpureus]|nr:hypothetical protein M758_3G078000 [Ceratodon purpureus]